jgi:cell division FtsZ-interacting protein ZapD
MNELDTTINNHKQEGRVWWSAPACLTAREERWNGVTWNGYRIPVGVRLTDLPPRHTWCNDPEDKTN